MKSPRFLFALLSLTALCRLSLASPAPVAVLPVEGDAGTEGADLILPSPADCRETSPAVAFARLAAPEEGIALSIPLDLEARKSTMQEELEAHPDPEGAARTAAAIASVEKSVLVPRPEGTGPAKRVFGWHPYWADSTDRDAYAYSNLTHLAYFSAEVNPTNGTIANLHAWNTDPVVETAHSNGVKVVLTATLFTASLNHILLTNTVACNRLVTNLVSTVTARGGDGICIDFESVGSWSGATKALTAFMSNLVVAAHAENLDVSICLPSVDWYADFAVGEYEKLGVDCALIMGYDYYYAASSTPGPVAPLFSSAQWIGASSWCSVDYSTRYYLGKMTNAAHLALAVPWYGRKWRAASSALGAASSGSSYSSAVVYPLAADQANTYGRLWDTNSSCPYYAYTSGSYSYQCFYDDPESLALKFDYANDKGLGGVGIWCLTHAPDSSELWDLLGEKFASGSSSSGTTPPSAVSGDAPVAQVTGLSSDSFVFSWTPAQEDAAGYLLQTVAGDATATETALSDTCAVVLSGGGEPMTLRVRNASSTNWSDAVSVTPGMVPANLVATLGEEGTSLQLAWDEAVGADAYQIDVSSDAFVDWTSTCPSTALGTNEFLTGQTWCYTGTVRTVTTSTNLAAGPGYCATATYAGHYLAGFPGQALQSWDFPLYGATAATLSFSNCPWNAARSSVGITCSVLRVYYRLDKGPWNFLGECRASSTQDTDWSEQSFSLPYLDASSLAVKIVAPYAERYADGTSGSLRGAGLKNIQLSFSGTGGRYNDATRLDGYPKTVTAANDTVEGLAADTPYWLRVQAVGPSARSVWVETSATPAAGGEPEPGSGTLLPLRTIWDFTESEGWTANSASLFTGETNINGSVWSLTKCFAYPSSTADGDTGYLSLYTPPGSAAVSPAFAGVVTQLTSVFRPASAGDMREVTLLASTNGGSDFIPLAVYAPTNRQNYTNTLVFSPALDGGEAGVIFCASNSGTSGTVHFRRLSVEGYSSASGGGESGGGESGLEETYATQPAGALSGVVVYCSAGHGFTANAAQTAWITGRGISNGIVEDFGNLDQLNFFVRQAWKAGATVVPFRPVGHQTNEIVLDNVDTAQLAGKGVVTYGGTWYNSSQTSYYHAGGESAVPYRYAYVSTTGTTAWACFRPDIPLAGEYPVYAWARYGSDRVNQLYRIHHAGGVTDVRVPHAQVGNGWVWLGNYFFAEGTGGSVNVSNYAPDADDETCVVIADAIRFGNGMGDIACGTAGVSGYPRELEGAKYWVQRMVLDSANFPDGIYNSCSSDQDSNVSAPNRMALQMCRTNGWARWRRVYLSFHSNASSSTSARGTWGLVDSRISSATWAAAQTNLARQIAEITTADMLVGAAQGLFDAWTTSKSVYAGTFGEIYNGGIYAAMDPTIDEVGFHTSSSDAAVLRSLVGREWLARGALRGVISHLAGWYSAVPLVYPPDRPEALAASNSAPGAVTVSWRMPGRNGASGGEPDGFTLYTSSDGLAFGNPVSVAGAEATSCTLTGLAAGTSVYFRVCATNAGGESADSPVAGVCVSADGAPGDVLVVDGFDRCGCDLSPKVYFANNIAGSATLVRPRMINAFDYVKEHGAAIAAAGRSFDSLHHSRLDAATLARYGKVVWHLGEESTADETFSESEQALVAEYLAGGGRLFVSGAEIGWDLFAQGSDADKAFLTNVLGAVYFEDSGGTSLATGSTGGIWTNLAISFNYTNAPEDIYAANYPDVFTPAAGAAYAASYGTGANGANGAAIQYDAGTYRTLVMGIPFETITSAVTRATLMTRVLDWFDEAGGTNEPTGAVQVLLLPAEAGGEGRWSLDGGETWRESGETACEVSAGTCEVEFLPLVGWYTPSPQSVAVAADDTACVTATYTAAPPVAVAASAVSFGADGGGELSLAWPEVPNATRYGVETNAELADTDGWGEAWGGAALGAVLPLPAEVPRLFYRLKAE